MRSLMPPGLAVLLTIGTVDLVATVWLYHAGLIVELNPLMRGLLERGEWAFALGKAATLVAAWWVMARHARTNRNFVNRACLMGSGAYLIIWLFWFMGAARA